jgi:transcriptional regulator with XRE-family HTH domain
MEFKEIGQEISFLRRQKKISQQKVANQTGISRSTLNALEKGRAGDVGLRKVLKILDYLGYEMRLKEKSALPTLEELRSDKPT